MIDVVIIVLILSSIFLSLTVFYLLEMAFFFLIMAKAFGEHCLTSMTGEDCKNNLAKMSVTQSANFFFS